MNNEQLYAFGFYQGFILSASNPAVAVQLPPMQEMRSPFLDGVAAGIAQHQRQRLTDINDFTRS